MEAEQTMHKEDQDPGPGKRPTPPDVGWDFMGVPEPKTFGHPAVRQLPRNEKGRDLIVSDIHGQRETFERLVEAVHYSPEEGDRLLLLGDLIDRGPDSQGMLQWLQRDDVECIRGNHEQLLLDAFDGEGISWLKTAWTGSRNGGQWGKQLDAGQREEWCEAVRKLPLALEVETANGPLVLVHAEIPQRTPWWAFKAWLEEPESTDSRVNDNRYNARILALWARDRYSNRPEDDQGVPDVWRAFHGHTPQNDVVKLGNIRWIDLGAAYVERYANAAVACVAISPDGQECEPVRVRIKDVDPDQRPSQSSDQW